MGHPVAAFYAAVAFVEVMKRSDHVSLSSTIMVSSNQVVPKQAEKKLRKRRELNARAAPHHVIVPRGRTRKRPTSKTTAHLLGKGQSSGSSSFHDEFDEDDDEADGEKDNDDDQPHRHQHHSAHHRLYTLYIVRISNGGMHSAVYRGLFYMLVQFIMCIVTILHLCH
mgnify:CR=1 FL=1